MMRESNRFLRMFSSPAVVMAGMAGGFIIGAYFEDVARVISPVGKIYLAFLNMCILPIIITAIISGLAKLIRTPGMGKRFPRIILGFIVLLIVPGVVGVGAALLGKSGIGMSETDLGILGDLMMGKPAGAAGEAGSLVDLIVGIVPWNFFNSLSTGQTISIVFACIFIGMGAGFTKSRAADDLVALIDAVYDIFNLLFRWAVYFLPIGVCCVIADHMSGIDLRIFRIMTGYIVNIYAAVLFLILCYQIVMWRVVGGSFGNSVAAMKDPLVLAFTVDSSIVAIKPCLDSLEEALGVDREAASLIVPFSMITNRQGKILLFSFTAIFMAQLYGLDLNYAGYAAVIIGSALAGMAAPGGGVLLVPMMAVVLGAINVPSALAYVIFTINAPIVERILSALTVQGSCLLASLSDGGSVTQTRGGRP